MRTAISLATISIFVLPAVLEARELPLRRIVLSTGGVAYLERETAEPDGTPPTLTVRRDQVDDVLKSLVVRVDGTGVGLIDLPGDESDLATRDPLFTPETLASPAALLGALRGAEVRVTGGRGATGRPLSINEETRIVDGGGTETRHRLTLLTAEGIVQFTLEDVDEVTPTDPELRSRLDRALAATIAAADAGRRTLTLRPAATPTKSVAVGYVVAAPLWKSTYRLVLPTDGGGRADLQGWALLENRSGEDWRDVDLTVMSGDPVTFRQNLYAAINVDRPVAPIEIAGRTLPDVDQRANAIEAATVMREAVPAPLAAPAPAPGAKSAGVAPGGGLAADLLSTDPVAPPPPSAEATEGATGVVFHHPRPVTLADGASLMMPIVARAVPVERVSLLPLKNASRNPLSAVRLTNDTGAGLPPGALTLYEISGDGSGSLHVGDARLGALPAGESRFLSFAVDQKVTVDRSRRVERGRRTATIVDGVMTLTVVDRETTAHAITGPTNEARRVVVEYPVRDGWTVVAPASGLERTGDAWRVGVDVPAGKTVNLDVVAERPRSERLVLADLADDRISALAVGDALPPSVRAAFVELARLRAVVRDAERDRDALKEERETLVADQERLRDNLAALPKESDLARKTLAKMAEEEARLDKLQADDKAAAKRVGEAKGAVLTHIRSLKL